MYLYNQILKEGEWDQPSNLHSWNGATELKETAGLKVGIVRLTKHGAIKF